MIYDFCIVGGGIVGLATAMKLLAERPEASLVLVEKEHTLAFHQTGHNSGVIHAGIYYPPGSLKANLCRRGNIATKRFCDDHSIPYDVIGKLLVASNPIEMTRMKDLYERALKNGLDVKTLSAEELREREPNVVGDGALFLASTGIVDYRAVCKAMANVITSRGGNIRLGERIESIRESSDLVSLDSASSSYQCRQLIVCAGLQSDRLARLAGLEVNHQIVPFRGEYYELPARKKDIVNHLIYPIPDPELPFLGIHLTPMIDGSITVGPNAVLGFSREGYPKSSVNVRDMLEYVRFPGFWKTIRENLRSGITEMKNSLFKEGYLKQCQKYCPSLEIADLCTPKAGIRAQAVMHDGTLVGDFLFLQSPRMLHVCNAPSPAATSAIPIGETIAEKILEKSG